MQHLLRALVVHVVAEVSNLQSTAVSTNNFKKSCTFAICCQPYLFIVNAEHTTV